MTDKFSKNEQPRAILRRAPTNTADSIYELLLASFATEEIRDRADFIATFRDPKFTPYDIIDGGAKVGFIGIWDLDGFTYIEHFAMYPQFRNRGYGAQALGILQNAHKRLILEAEPQTDEITGRRLEFYKRSGFAINDHEYLQPPFRPTDKPFPLRLLSYPVPFADIDSVIECIYAHVYNTDLKTVKQKYLGKDKE